MCVFDVVTATTVPSAGPQGWWGVHDGVFVGAIGSQFVAATTAAADAILWHVQNHSSAHGKV